MGRRLNHYADKFTWDHDIGHHVIAHHDGRVSIMLRYGGIDTEMLLDTEVNAQWSVFNNFLSQFDQQYTIEFHHWRQEDNRFTEAYRAKVNDYVRGGEFARYMREQYADHYDYMAMLNDVAVVISLPSYKTSLFRSIKNKLIKQGQAGHALETHVRRALRMLPNARLCTADEYRAEIRRSFDPERFELMPKSAIDPTITINSQLISRRPELTENQTAMRMGNTYVKTFYLFLYPDTDPGWFFPLATSFLNTHTVMIMRMQDTRKALADSKQASRLSDDQNQDELADTKSEDLAGFRRYIADSGAAVWLNCFIHTVYADSLEDIEEYTQHLHTTIGNQGQWRDAWYIQQPFLRYSMPGLGYLSRMFRTDAADQALAMIPAQVFRTGDSDPQQLRFGYWGNPVQFSYSSTLNHAVTLAMSRGGKDVQKAAEVAETFPLGVDWYIMESDPTYRWVVEGVGGVYSVLDPTESVVNPLPPYAAANLNETLPLAANLVGGTVSGLTYLFIGKPRDGQKFELDMHEEAVANAALQLLYALPAQDGREAPTLVDLLVELQRGDCAQSEEQRAACVRMAANLDSFLSTTAGRIFSQQNNLVLSEGITGVDIKQLSENPTLLKFMLSFLSLRFAQLAYMRTQPARILLNELHFLADIAPEMLGPLVKGVARMGGKRGASVDLISQEKEEIDSIELGVLNQMVHRTFLYRQKGHEELCERVRMPDAALHKWMAMPAPFNFDWRPAVRGVGNEYYDLRLTYPQVHLDLTGTQPQDLEYKALIEQVTIDPMERLALLRRAKETNDVTFITERIVAA